LLWWVEYGASEAAWCLRLSYREGSPAAPWLSSLGYLPGKLWLTGGKCGRLAAAVLGSMWHPWWLSWWSTAPPPLDEENKFCLSPCPQPHVLGLVVMWQ
jgi:hypothetical protein